MDGRVVPGVHVGLPGTTWRNYRVGKSRVFFLSKYVLKNLEKMRVGTNTKNMKKTIENN